MIHPSSMISKYYTQFTLLLKYIKIIRQLIKLASRTSNFICCPIWRELYTTNRQLNSCQTSIRPGFHWTFELRTLDTSCGLCHLCQTRPSILFQRVPLIQLLVNGINALGQYALPTGRCPLKSVIIVIFSPSIHLMQTVLLLRYTSTLRHTHICDARTYQHMKTQ